MKNLRLRVKEDGNVYVSCPYGVPVSEIESFVERKKDWIAEQRAKLSKLNSNSENGISDGSIITIFGNKYIVRVTEGKGDAFIENDKVIVPSSGLYSVETSVIKLLGEECRRECMDAAFCFLRAAGYNGPQPKLAFKYMKSKWGSYGSAKNEITLNLALCKIPKKYVHYVVAHEIVHIYARNHSKSFYELGEKIYRDFLKTDRELNKIGIPPLLS